MKGALVTALRSHYDVSVVELIAPVFLRKQFNLKDGHKVKVEVLTLPLPFEVLVACEYAYWCDAFGAALRDAASA